MASSPSESEPLIRLLWRAHNWFRAALTAAFEEAREAAQDDDVAPEVRDLVERRIEALFERGEERGERKLAGTRRDRGCSFRSIPGFKRLGHGGP